MRQGILDRLQPTHPEHLTPGSLTLHLRSEDSVDPNAASNIGDLDKDWSFAYGGIYLVQDVELRLTWNTAGDLVSATPTSWRMSGGDRYNWDQGKLFPVPVPATTKIDSLPPELQEVTHSINGYGGVAIIPDSLMADWEARGVGRQFDTVIETFDVPEEMQHVFIFNSTR